MDILEAIKKPFESLGESVRTGLYEGIREGLINLGVFVWEGLSYIAPDILGIGAFVTGGWVIFNGMIGKDIVKPMAVYFAGTILLAGFLLS